MMFPSPLKPVAFKQKGVALIIVLLVVALVSIIATEMGTRLQLQVKRASNIKDNNQAYWYAMGAEQFAQKSIAELLDTEEIIHGGQPWAQQALQFPLPGGGLEATLVDMQTCFNLNALDQGESDNRKDAEATAFYELLNKSELNIPSFNAETLRDSLIDWIDQDSNLTGNFGAEDPDYESLEFPYLAANGIMVSKSELRLVKGVNMDWFQSIMPMVCAIPDSSDLKINVNTLTDDQAPLLAALTGMSLDDARTRISGRPSDGYENIETFLTEPEIASQSLSDQQKAWFDITTKYFILHIKSRYNGAAFNMSSLIKIGEGNRISVIRREFGGKL